MSDTRAVYGFTGPSSLSGRKFTEGVTYAVPMGTEAGNALLKRRASMALTAVGTFWLGRTYWQQILLVLALLIAKNAFDIELRNIQEAYLPGAQAFPEAVGYFSGSFGQVVLASGLGITTTTQWVVVHAMLMGVALAAAFFLVNKAGPSQRGFLILVLASATATSSLFLSVGKYDIITFLGAVILALARSLPGGLLGALIMASGNPEQAVVAAAALLLLSFASEFHQFRLRASFALSGAMAIWALVQFWLASSGMPAGRVQLLPEYLSESIARVVAFPGTALWSWLNAGWLVALAVVLVVSGPSRKWIVGSLVLLPGLATIITADGGRVFGLIVLPAYLIAGAWLGRTVLSNPRSHPQLIGAFACALLVLPVTIEGQGWFFAQVFGFIGRVT